jgi:hypothetical protein
MHHFLLDAGGAGLYLAFALFAGTIFILCAVLLEGLVMILMKYSSGGKPFWDAFIVNLVSLVIGFILIGIDPDFFDIGTLQGLAILFGVTMLVETPLLYLRNKTKPFSKTVLVSLVMNILSYILLYFINGVNQ